MYPSATLTLGVVVVFLIDKIFSGLLLILGATAIMFFVCRQATTVAVAPEIYLSVPTQNRIPNQKDLGALEQKILSTANTFYRKPNSLSDAKIFTLAQNALQLQMLSSQRWHRVKRKIKRSIPAKLKQQMIQQPDLAEKIQPSPLNFLLAVHIPAKIESFNFIKGTALYYHGNVTQAIASYEAYLDSPLAVSTPLLANWASLQISQRAGLNSVIDRLKTRQKKPIESDFLKDLLLLRTGEAYVARRNFAPAVTIYEKVTKSSHVEIARKANLRLGDLRRRSLDVGYVGWLIRFVTLNLGRSAATGEEVGPVLNSRLGETTKLLLSASGIALSFSLLIVAFLIEFPESLLLKLSTASIYVISGVPVFLMSYLCLKWMPNWLYPDNNGNFNPLFYGLAGSCLAFGSASINLFIQKIRQESLLLLNRDFFLAVRVRQANVFLHLLKNLVIPITSIYCAQFPIMLSGAIVVEMVFTYPGIGHWLLLAVKNKDFPVVMPICSVLVVLVCTANLIKDLIQFSVDPKLRV